MVADIRRWPDPTLTSICQPVGLDDKDVRGLVQDMKETLRVVGGLALAANQIGVMKQVVVWGNGEVFVNPKVIEHGEGTNKGQEGCLSLPGYTETVNRWDWVTVEYRTLEFDVMITSTFRGPSARVIQHEIDHLNGVFFAQKGGMGWKDRLRAFLRKNRR